MAHSPFEVVQALQEVELAAADVLELKQQSIQLDMRRHQTREALRSLHKNKGEKKKEWLCLNNTFIKMPQSTAKQLLDKDFETLDDEINETRVQLKKKVNILRELENKEQLKGFELKGLSRQEMEGIKDLL